MEIFLWSAIIIGSFETSIVQGNIAINFLDKNTKWIGQSGKASVVITHLEEDLPKKLIFNPELDLGEAYTNETLLIENDDLFGLLIILARNAKPKQNHWFSKLVKLRQNAFRPFFKET